MKLSKLIAKKVNKEFPNLTEEEFNEVVKVIWDRILVEALRFLPEQEAYILKEMLEQKKNNFSDADKLDEFLTVRFNQKEQVVEEVIQELKKVDEE